MMTQLISTTPLPVLALATLGALSLFRYSLSLCALTYNLAFRKGTSLSKYGAGSENTWAMITGASDGIGKEFAIQLAKSKFNIVLLARTESKLLQLAQDIRNNYKVHTRVIPFDFSSLDSAKYALLETEIKDLDISVLINNVGTNHEFPVPFLEEKSDVIDRIINVNIASILKLTHMVVPRMVERKRGLILNVGSFAGLLPQPLLSVYSGSKSFLLTWSQALGRELKSSGVDVQCLSTYFVVSNMSKIRSPTKLIPSAKSYVASTLSNVGNPGGASTPYTSTPYPMHALLNWIIDHIGTPHLWLEYVYSTQVNIRKRALRKQKRTVENNHIKKEE